MKLSIPNSTLLPVVSALRGVVQGARTIEALSHFLFRYSGEQLTVTAADTDIEMVFQLDPANLTADEPGQALIPARQILGIVSNSGETELTSFNFDKDVAQVTGEHSRFKLASLDPDQFPLMESVKDEKALFKVRADDFQHLLAKTDFAMAQDDARYYLEGLLLTQEDKHLIAVATDGHRLALSQIPHSGEAGQEARVILPRRAVHELKRVLPQAEETISIGVGEKLVCVHLGSITLTTKLIEGSKYPDYKRVIPADFAHTISLDSNAFRRTLAKAQVIEDATARLCFSNNKLNVLSRSDLDEADIEQDVEYGGESLEVGFNLQYLTDVMNVVDADRVLFELKDPSSAVQIREDDAAKYIVMPMRL